MPISSSSGGRGLIIFGVVISLEVLFENELKIHKFIVLFILVFQLLLQILFTDPMKYIWYDFLVYHHFYITATNGGYM